MRLLFKVLVLALLCAGVILVAPSRAASDVPGPKLGLQTWTLRHQTFEQVVNFAVANKIRSVQFTSQHLNPEAPLEETRRKKALLDQYGIVPYAFGVARTSSDPATNRKLFEFARFIGAKLIVVEPAPADWDSLESLVKEYDIRLAIHNHGVGTTYGDPQVVKQILANRDPRIGVCLDVGWITQAGFDVAKVFREYQDRVYDIHFKDKKVSVPGDPSAVDTLIGHGSANYPGLFGEIQRSAWSGVMAIETDSEEFATRPQPFVTAAKSFFAHSAPASSAPADREDSITLFNGRDLNGCDGRRVNRDAGAPETMDSPERQAPLPHRRLLLDPPSTAGLEYRLKPGQKADQISGITGGLSSAAGPGNRPTIGLRHFGSTTAREAVIEVASDLEATRVANSVCGSSASCRSSLRCLRIAPELNPLQMRARPLRA